jgi:hypothetical protein
MGKNMTPPRTRASDEAAELENRRNNEEAAVKQAEESELLMAQMRAQARLMEGLRAELESTKRAAAEKELQWQTTLATLTAKLDAREHLPETTTDKDDKNAPHQGDSFRSLAASLAEGKRELMKEVAELKKQVAVGSSRPSTPLGQAPLDQVDEVKQQPASSTSEMAEWSTKSKASRRHQTRKGEGDPSSDGDSSDSHERRRETSSKNGRGKRRAQRNRR